MNFLGRMLKAITGLAGVLLALAAIAYGVLFAVNFRDQLPSDDTVILAKGYESSGAVRDADNSYLMMLGFAAAPNTDPHALGMKRWDWMEVARPDYDSATDPLADDYNFRSMRSAAVEELADSCSDPDASCLASIEQSSEIIGEWLSTEAWLLNRYHSLIGMTEFKEAVPFELLAPLPSYEPIFEGQRLLIMELWVHAGNGDAETVQQALDEDLSFWRMVLQNSDALITKMIATAAIVRHLKMGNLVLRRLLSESTAEAIPDAWKTPISMSERSMRRCLGGEWIYADQSIRGVIANGTNPLDEWSEYGDVSTWDRFRWAIMKPLWQPQDSSNRHAQLMLQLSDLFEVPLEEIPSAIDQADEIQGSAFRPYRRLYNLTGDILYSAAGYWGFSSYAARVADLEGIRRATILAATLRTKASIENDVARSILDNEIVNPYTNKPFEWHEDPRTVVFYGLEPNERAEHKIIY